MHVRSYPAAIEQTHAVYNAGWRVITYLLANYVLVSLLFITIPTPLFRKIEGYTPSGV